MTRRCWFDPRRRVAAGRCRLSSSVSRPARRWTRSSVGFGRAGANGTAWGQVAVLYGTRKGIVDPLLNALQKNGVPNLWVSDSKNRENRKKVVSAGDVVRVSTMQGLKGLEFSRVFMCGVNDIYDAGADDETHRRKIAYVAMTRAMDELMVTVSGSGPIGQAIQAAAR